MQIHVRGTTANSMLRKRLYGIYWKQKGIWKKSGDNWECIYVLTIEYPLNSACWYDDKLWITHNCGILVWDGKELL